MLYPAELKTLIHDDIYSIIFITFCQDFLRKSLKLIGAGSGNRTHLSSLEGWSITDIRYLHIGADEGSRTPTPKALDPKSSASANSATSAYYFFLVEDGGFEPPKAMLTDLQSAPFGHSGNPPYNWSW